MTDDEKRIFLKPLAAREESEIKKLVRELVGRFNTMYQILSIIIEEELDEHMDYLSSIYTELTPVLTAITCYVVENDLSGRNPKVDNYIINSQKILGLLKELHERNECKKNGIRKTTKDQYSELSTHDILLEIKDYLETM